jgi:hypothetical protein
MDEPVADSGSFARIFLAGTIDMGNSVDWQKQTVKWFSSRPGRYILYNPRRDDYKNTPEEFDFQVKWELEHLEKSDLVIMNILGNSQSPVSLLEMGIYMKSGKLYVACEPDYFRYGNVKITCRKYGVPLYGSLDSLLNSLPEFAVLLKHPQI